MGSFWMIAEEKIREALRRGDFDHLPGTGKPLHLEDDDRVPQDWRLAYHLLQTNGLTLPWIAEGREIEDDWQALLSRTRATVSSSMVQSLGEEEKQDFLKQVAGLNQRIRHFNLSVPLERFQRRLLDGERELARIVQKDEGTD